VVVGGGVKEEEEVIGLGMRGLSFLPLKE